MRSRSSNFSPLSPLDPSVAYCEGGDSRPELKELHCVDDASLFLAVYLLDTIDQLGPLFSKAVTGMGAAWLIVNVIMALTGSALIPGAGDSGVGWEAHLAGFAAGVLLIGVFGRLAPRGQPPSH